jgi:polyisoprenoid-binding protein YceI
MSLQKTKIIVGGIFLLFSVSINAQGKYFTKDGKISFNASTAMENIEAKNKSAVAVFDTRSGDLQFAVLMKGFEFKKALMQEHFNTDYVESDKFPRAEFKGQVSNNSEIDFSRNGSFTAHVKGKLTIHGETKDIETTGIITIKDGKILTLSTFTVLLADYKITVPGLVRDYISKIIKITVDCTLEPFNQ